MTAIRPIVEPGNLRHFFQESVCDAMTNQHLKADEHTVVYLVNLLVHFTDARNLFHNSPDGPVIKPLAVHLAEAAQAPSRHAQVGALRELGDMALFLAGLFGERLERSLVDIDYYIAMGGGAYESLADMTSAAGHEAALQVVFTELGENFRAFVEIFTEVGDQAATPRQADILRLYEQWLKFGSPRARQRLMKLGVPLEHLNRATDHQH